MELEEAAGIITGTEYKYIAVDKDLDIFGYVKRPRRYRTASIWESYNGDCEYLGQYTGDVPWEETLTEVD